MHLKQVILDGFKSYAHRTVLDELDPHFNAITGLNGSGKSNIFDALCFVMGISSLKRVRAEDVSDLIFKNGNAGIQRATVTIEFINNDPSTAPVAFPIDQFPLVTVSRQVIAGGRQKFFLNGRVSDQTRVKQFFHSISLNVDNPHFLVLQGTVTKLLCMRSDQILGWLEEAAGTRVFDARRRSAEQLIATKERRLAEISGMLERDIGPLLRSKDEEQRRYAEYIKAVEQLDGLRNFRVAHEFWKVSRFSGDETQLLTQKTQIEHDLTDLPAQRVELQARLQAVDGQCVAPRQRETDVRQQLAEHRRMAATGAEKLAATRRTFQESSDKTDLVQQAEAELAQFLDQTKERWNTFNTMNNHLKELNETIPRLREALRLHRSGVRVGQSGKPLVEERQIVGREWIQTGNQLRDAREELDTAVRRHETMKQRSEQNQQRRIMIQHEFEQAKTVLSSHDTAHAPLVVAADNLNELRRLHSQTLVQLREAEHILSGNPLVAALPFDPIPELKDAILGRLGEHLRATNPQYSLGLSVGSSGHLSKVLVRRDSDAEALIHRGHLRTRTAFIALNRMTKVPSPTAEKVAAVQAIATRFGGWASIASSLIEYPSFLEPVVSQFFGSVWICSSLDIAKRIAYDPTVRMRAITIDGDAVSPSGVISGGDSSQVRNWFREFASASEKAKPARRLQEAERHYAEQIRALEQQLEGSRDIVRRWREAAATVDSLEVQLQGLGTDNVKAGEKTISKLECHVQNLSKHKDKLEKKCQELDAELADNSADHEQQLKHLETELKQKENQTSKLQNQAKKSEAELEKFEERRTLLEQRIMDADNDQKARQSERELEEQRLLATTKAAEEATTEVERSQQVLVDIQKEITKYEEESRQLEAELAELEEKVSALTQTHRSIEHELQKMRTAAKDAKNRITQLTRQHPWLLTEESLGEPSSKFDFSSPVATRETLDRLRELEQQSEALGRRVNKRATIMYEQSLGEFERLSQQRQSLEFDKGEILETIQRVEQRKWEALDEMVSRVSRGFSQLFSACLPHAQCRLVEERNEETGRLSGLSVRVSFSGQEKEGLSELSGGQRSLLALCLILAILRLRPAPFYVLDEIDAALDPSHTQNIGSMLAKHFSNAQFLLVSLKDGMYNNANCVYEVRNTQGYSEITRQSIF